ncbi:MFS transporter [Bosea vaviloviae]|uniref:Major facilitator superfamily (MFS) profile domain-containing protein n=1 Tax=Bosea vaviloviae TaxID=1526658 RepID=A0A0N1F608_9HYPH|nr:MFS transporter [Bosea vaviloviae]KPH81842.1 hypothetical protein AE618_06535 [Bosea vaviloviae]
MDSEQDDETAEPTASQSTMPGSSVAALGAIVAGALVLQVAGTILNTLVPLSLALAKQSPLLIGLVGSAYSVGFLWGCFKLPPLIRRIGHIRAFAVFASLQTMSTISIALLPAELWIVPRLVMGLAAAGHGICIESWISGQAHPSQRGRIFGLYQILNRVALIASQLAVGYAAIAMESMLLLAAMAFSTALIPVCLTRARGPDSSQAVTLKLRLLWTQAPAAVIGCLYVGLMGGPLVNVAPAYGILIGLDQKAATLLTASVQIGALLLQGPTGLLADRLDSRIIMLAAAGTVIAALVALGVSLHLGALHLPGLLALFAIVGAGSIPLYTVAVTHAFVRLKDEQPVALSAGLLFLWGIGSTIGPLASSAAMQVVGPQGLPIYFAVLSIGLCVFLVIRLVRKPAPAPVESSRDARPISVPGMGSRLTPLK